MTPGSDVIVLLVVPQDRNESMAQAWELNQAAGRVLNVTATDEGTARRVSFSATVEDLTVKGQLGLQLRLRVSNEQRDAVLVLGSSNYSKRFRFHDQPGAPSSNEV
jgi:hypothetical protein